MRLCLVTTCYAPSGAIGGRRCERIAGTLAARGWEVTVVTPAPRWMEPPDPTIVAPPGPEHLATAAWIPRTVLRRAAARSSRLGSPLRSPPPTPGGPARRRSSRARRVLDLALAPFEFPDPYGGWIPFAVRAVRGRTFDVVLGSTPSPSAAIAARRIAERAGARLLLDYRDPWTDLYPRDPDAVPRDPARQRAAEDACLDRADAVTAVTRTLCEWLGPRTRTPPVVVPNGFAGGARRAPRPPGDPVHLVYAGSLAYGRGLGPVFAAMARLRAEAGPRVRLAYLGGQGALARAQAEAAGAAELLEDRGPLPLRAALEAVRAADAAVVAVSPRYAYALPGKIFEILATGTPLLVTVPAGADADRLVREHHLGWSHPDEDVAGIAASLRDLAAGRIPEPVRLAELGEQATMDTLEAVLRGLT